MTPPNVKDLLLAPRLDPQEVIALFGPYGFKEPGKADANLQALADDAPARQSLADLGNSFELVRSMRLAPITRDAVLQLLVVTLLPVAPLLLTMIPLNEIMRTLVKVLM